MFVLKVLGGAALERGGVPVTGRAVHRRRLALLALLASARGRMVRRERLIGYLWPEHPGDAARHLLSESLYILRKAVGEDMFVSAGDELALDPATVGSDLADFLAALDADDPERAVAAYGGPFLDGFVVSDAPEFERWAEEERDRHARGYARALEQLAEAREAEGDYRGAAEWWKRLARHDPFSSRIALRTMQALEAGGERAAAIRHATSHAALMRAEMEAEPDAAVEEFARRLREAPRDGGARADAHLRRRARRARGGHGGAVARAAPPAVAAQPERGAGAVRPARRAGRRWLAPGVAALAVLAAVAVGLVASRQRARRRGGERVRLHRPPLRPARRLAGDARPGGAAAARRVFAVDGPAAGGRAAHPRPALAQRRAAEPARGAAHRAVGGGGQLVWGEITPLGDSIMVRAALYDVTRGGDPVQTGTIRVGRDLRGRLGALRRAGVVAAGAHGRRARRHGNHLAGGVAGVPAGAPGHVAMGAGAGAGRSWRGRWRWTPGTRRPTCGWRRRWRGAGWRDRTQLARERRARPGRQRGAFRSRADAGRRAGGAGRGALSGRLRAVRAAGRPRQQRLRGVVRRGRVHPRRPAGGARPLQPLRLAVPEQLPPRGAGVQPRAAHHPLVAPGVSRRGLRAAERACCARTRRICAPATGGGRGGGGASPPTPRWRRHAGVRPLDHGGRGGGAPGDGAAHPPRRQRSTTARSCARITLDWARAFPQSADAHEALALALEALGELRDVRQGAPSAFAELARARALTTDPDAAAAAVHGAGAAVAAGGGLSPRAGGGGLACCSSGAPRAPTTPASLAPLAMLTGRVEQARALLRTSVPEMQVHHAQGRVA